MDTREEPDRHTPSRDPVLVGIGVTVTVVWVLNVLTPIFVPRLGYDPDPMIHGIFTVIVGGIWRLGYRSSDKRADHE